MSTDYLTLPLALEPARLAATLPVADPLRARMEAAVARLEGLVAAILEQLDQLAGDADLEPEPDTEDGADDEPDLAGFELLRRPRSVWVRHPHGSDYIERFTDAEEANDDDLGSDTDTEQDTADDEPWLGRPEGAQGCGNVRCGVTDDREIDAPGEARRP